MVKRKRSIYSYKRYWYHISQSLNKNYYELVPWGNDKGYNRCDTEPNTNRICVAPTIAQCITAVPYTFSDTYNVYRTVDRVKALEPSGGIFDSTITDEGWLVDVTKFQKVGTFSIPDIEIGEGIRNVITESGSGDSIKYSLRVLRWWEKINFNKYMRQYKKD